MGCVSSKPKTVRDGGGISGQRVPSKRISRTSSSREGGPQMMNRSDSRTSLIDRKSSNSIRICDDRSEKSRVKPEGVLVDQSEIRVVPKAWEGEQVAAGWPSWLVTAAADTITGWIPRRSDSFQRLGKVCIFFPIYSSSYFLTFFYLCNLVRMLIKQWQLSKVYLFLNFFYCDHIMRVIM